jgi:hypothetical protein
MRKAGLTDQALCQAVSEMSQGLIDADLGGNVVKKRVPLPGRGKRGGARTIVATNRGDRWFFLFQVAFKPIPLSPSRGDGTESAALCGSSPYSMYCLVAARLPSRSWSECNLELYGFEKNERANIDKDEIKALQELAAEYLAIDDQGIELAVSRGKFMEVHDGN